MTDWTTFLHALLPHPDQPLVLTQKLALPNRAYNDRVWVADTGLLKPLLEELTGAPINILRYIAHHRDEDLYRVHCIHLLELRDEFLPQAAAWQPIENVLESGSLHPDLHAGLTRWQVEQRLGITPDRRAPWALPGWYAKAEQWIADQIARHHRGAIQRIEPLKSWSISCVLKVTTDTGVLYFKASRDLPLFVNEGAVVAQLAELYSGRLPIPVAFFAEQGWMLLDDFGEALGWDAPLDQQVSLMKDFAQMQIDSSGHIEELLAAGCIDRRIDTLPSYIELLFADELVVGPLTLEEREKLKQLAPQLRTLIAELNSLPIPAALLHGDLHAGNVTLRNNSFLYFDWTDAAVSHPYFDMLHIFREEDEPKRTTLQEAYLSVWEEQYPKADVRRAWELAGTLFGLYHAVSYQYIVNGIEELVQPELNYAFYFLRKLLMSLEKLNAQ